LSVDVYYLYDPHEDSYHIFFHCCTAVGVWRTAGLWSLIEPLLNRFDDAPEIIFHLLEHVTAMQAELIATIWWSIWKSRSLNLWQQVTERIIAILLQELNTHLSFEGTPTRSNSRNTYSLVMQLLSRCKQQDKARPGGMLDRDGRSQYMRGRLKCNVDASLFTSTNRLGIDMCIRDEEGHFVRAKTMWLTPVCPVDVGEALGLYYAIRCIHYLRLQNVDFEDDSKRVADYFNRSKGRNQVCNIVYDIKCGVNFVPEHS